MPIHNQLAPERRDWNYLVFNGLPPGSLVRSYACDVLQLNASTDTAARRGSERKCGMNSPPSEASPTVPEYGPRAGAVKDRGLSAGLGIVCANPG